MDHDGQQARTPWHRSGAVIAVAMVVMNVATYGYTIVAARLLGPGSYGAFAAVMGLLLVLGVLQLGLQATGARRVAAHPGSVAEVERALIKVAALAGLALGVLCLLLSPLIDSVLGLDSLPTALLVAVTVFPMTLMGGQAGILQGERRWRALAVLYVAAGVPRLLLGTALLLARPTEAMAVLAVMVAFFAPVAVGWWALRRSAGVRSPHDSGEHGPRSILLETARNSQALLAFFALSSVDVIIARNVLDPEQAGLYAGGLILVKAVLFLPQFVVIIAFPSMSQDSQAGVARRALAQSVALVLTLGVVTVLGAWVLSGLALVFVGGGQYAAIEDDLWLFAILGTVLSVVQLLVYSVVARQARGSVYVVWAAFAALLVVTRAADDVTGLLLAVLGVDLVLLVVLLAVSLRRMPQSAPDHAEPAESPRP